MSDLEEDHRIFAKLYRRLQKLELLNGILWEEFESIIKSKRGIFTDRPGNTCDVALMADISTAYLTPDDQEMMQGREQCIPNHHSSVDPLVASDRTGPGEIFYLHPGERELMDEQYEKMREYGFSEQMCDICKWCAKQGYRYVLFDADGGEFTGNDFKHVEQ